MIKLDGTMVATWRRRMDPWCQIPRGRSMMRTMTKTDDSKDCEVPLLRGCRSHGGDEASRGGVRGDSRLQFVGWGH